MQQILKVQKKLQVFYITLFFLQIIQYVESRSCIPEPPCSTCDISPNSCTDCVVAHFLLGNECIPCTFPCNGCINLQKCFDCDINNSGYYLSGNECLPCQYPCLTCYQPTYCLSCGWDVERRVDDRFCLCKGDFYELVEEQRCILCLSPCIACLSANYCFDCDNVNSGLYSKNGVCKPCEYPCQTCASTTYCYSCGYDVDKRVNDQTCRCQDGWWDDSSECRPCLLPCTVCTSETFCLYCGSDTSGLWANQMGLCEPCFYPCVNCVGPGDCLSCGWDIERRNLDSTCSCKVGFYECGTKCKPCVPPCKACKSETHCLDCNNVTSGTFYYEENCKPCNYPCKTCHNEVTCIACGYDGELRDPTGGICNCISGYYEAGFECLKCISPCIICNSPTSCQDCNQNNSGFYLDTNLESCISCPYPCAKCSSPTNCLECGWDIENRIPASINPKCNCKPGLYQWGTICLLCQPPCNQCVDSAINCLTCKEGSYIDEGTCKFCLYPCLTCQTLTDCITCGWGPDKRYQPKITGSYEYLGETVYYYDNQECNCLDGYYAFEKDCLPCKLPCVTCNSKHECITFDCKNEVSSTYYDSTAKACLACPYPCFTCNNNQQCLTCGYGVEKRKSAAYQCICADTYYQEGQDCLPCQLPCVNCSSLTNCLTTNYQESISKQFYNISTGLVEFCQYPCLTCQNSPTNCLSCGYDTENRNSPPTCTCKSTFYQDGQVCKPCVLPCVTCSSETTCHSITCSHHNGVITSKSRDRYEYICRPCNFPCLTCYDYDPSNCTSCGYGADLRISPYYGDSFFSYEVRYRNECHCKNGYYLKGTDCLPCAYPCIYCYNQESCNPNRKNNYNNNYSNCDYSVSGLYYSGSQCKPCKYPCFSCYGSSGDSSVGYCYTCGYGSEKRIAPFIIYRNSRNIPIWNRNCECKSGYYEEDQQCKSCVLPCVTCVNLTTCTTIFDCDYTRSGLYRDGIQCKKCQYPCKFCTSSTNCYECGWDVQNRNEPQQNCSCKSGFYHDADKYSCFKCVLPCITCTAQDTCIQTYDCDQLTSGYYPSGAECKPCEYPCITCSSATKCHTCGFQPELRNPAPACSCKEGTFSLINKCVPCSLPCITCRSETSCITTYDCDQETSGMYSKNGICNICQYPCLTCTSETQCLTCKGNLNNRAEAPNCQCLDGYYNRGEECLKCELPCITCTSATTCKTRYDCDYNFSMTYKSGNSCIQCPYPCLNCESPSVCITCPYEITNRENPLNDSSCKCQDGFYEDSNKICKRCLLPCSQCTGPTYDQCQDVSSFKPCMPGEYRNFENKCTPCKYPCLTCTSAYNCTKCGYGEENRQLNNCACKPGFFHNSILKKCIPCIYPCINCSSSTVCISNSDCGYTVTGMYYYKNQCKKCQYPCLTCYYQPTNCYSCGYGGAAVRNHPSNSNRYCSCKSGFYEDNKECKPCIPPCITCRSAYVCITLDCYNSESNQYWDRIEKTCKDCVYPCATCNNSATDCTTCFNSPETRNPPNNCDCLDGYYEKQQNCLKCPLPCATCSSEKECILFDCSNEETGLYLHIPDNEGAWVPENCDELPLLEQLKVNCHQVTKTCQPCQYPCKTCLTLTKCLECGYSPQHRQSSNCQCNSNSYLDSDNQACVANNCNYPCITCEFGADSCTSCADGTFLMGNVCNQCRDPEKCLQCSDLNTCTECSDKYYLEDGVCVPCTYPCITCKTKTICLSCGDDYDFRNKPPSCTCLAEFYDNGQQTCVKCIKPCDTCFDTNIVSCLSCIAGYYLNGTVCAFCPSQCSTCDSPTVCFSCAFGYYLKGVQCLSCLYPCASCSNEFFCYTCVDDVDKRFPAPDCGCNNVDFDFYDNGKNNCSDCPDPIQACDPDSQLPLSCITGYYFFKDGTQIEIFIETDDGESKILKESCNCGKDVCYLDGEDGEDGEIICDESNKYIYGIIEQQDYSQCIQCMEGAASCTAIDNVIDCIDGYYKEGTICKKCIAPCQTCKDATYCYTCGYDPTNLRNRPPTCSCKEQYSEHGDKCDTCTAPCKYCTGFGIDKCLSCNDYYYLEDSYCLPCDISCFQCSGPSNTECVFTQQIKCRDGYFPEDNLCKSCVYPCQTCSSLTFCYTCGYDIENRFSDPDCGCRDEFSDDGEQCILCNTNCKTCIGKGINQCTSCNQGQYLVGTSCENCDPSCASCSTGPTVCQSCIDNWYLSGDKCLACVYPCITCYKENKCFTCGFNPERRYSPPDCNCMIEFSEYNNDCIECHQHCLQCTAALSENDCISCVEGRFLNGTTCIECTEGCKSCIEINKCINCKVGYYMEEDGITCTACKPPCLTCHSATFCYTCGYMEDKRINPPTCQCKTEYTPIGNEICGLCEFNCATCTAIGEFDCLTCVDGFYLNTDNVAPTNCLPCKSPCLNCGSTPETCTSCIDGYYFVIDGEISSCEQCVYPCQTCTSPVLCIECGYEPSNRTNAPQCECKNGLADTGSGCGQCNDSCLQCNGINADNCLSCYEGTYLLQIQNSELATCEACDEGCISCQTSSNICQSCKDKYYQDGTNCISCKYPCNTCYSDTECITCGGHVDDIDSDGNSKRRNPPTCACKRDQYSDNGIQCIVCSGNCNTCNSISPTDCVTCNHGYYIENTECKPCKEGCKYCSETDPTICTECYDGYFITTHDTYEDEQTCNKCQVPCELCINSATYCVTCGYCPQLRITAPTCAFKDSYVGTVTDNTNGTEVGCFTCIHPCKQCQGYRDNDCLRCNYEYVHDPDTLTCIPCNFGSNCKTCLLENTSQCLSCLDKYYLSGTECLPCVYPCVTCLTADYCHVCGYDDGEGTLDIDGNLIPAPSRRTGAPTCSCLDEYSDNGIRCVLCTNPCLTCMTESINDCLTCVIGKYFKPRTDNLGTCEDCPQQCTHCVSLTSCQQCQPKFYLDGESCIPCIYPCENCLNATFCYTCGFDLENKNPPPDCGCKPEFSDSYTKELGCIVCIGNCNTCLTADENNCTSCNDDFYLVGTECLPCHPGCNKCQDDTDSNCMECNDGYYLQGTNCIICKHPCVNCLSDTRCLSCKTGIERGLPPDCHCNDTFYDDGINGDCVDCPIPGSVCNNSDPDVYITCEDGYFIKTINDGESGNYQDCQQCPSQCATCLNENFCYECYTSQNRGAAPLCQCAIGYYHDGGNCTICPFPSLICTSATDYQACEEGYFIDIDRDSGISTCTKCSYPCITCLVDFSCESCAPDVSLRNPIPSCTCLNGYYDEKDSNGILTKTCKQCPDPSIQCLSNTEFLSCQDTYYHNADTNECLSCVYPCVTCVSATFCTLCGYDIINREDPPTCYCQFGDYYQKNPEDTHCTKCVDDSDNCIKCKSYNECLSCKDGYTLEGTYCAPCQPPCITCIGPICLSCGLAEEGSNTPSCDCLSETADSGTYRTCYDNSDEDCAPKPCISPCQNCKNETECVSCLPGDFRKDAPDCNCIDGFREDSKQNCVVPCDPGKYAIRDQCYECEHPCSECDGEATYCIQCSLGYKLAGSGTCDISCVFPCMDCLEDDPFTCKSRCQGLYRDINKNCECADNYYPDGDLCLPCVHPCENCSAIDVCTKCFDDGEARQQVEDGGNCECIEGYTPYLLTCVKLCEPGYFQNYNNCEQCHPQCLTCEGSGSNCLECTYGYYFQDLTCVRCPINCKNCESDGSGGQICTECSDIALGRSREIEDQCLCKDGYFERGTEDCGICVTPCVTCQNTRISCITCVENGLNREPAPDCNCLANFYGFENTCLRCNYTCKTCQFEAEFCLSCYGTGIHRTSNLPNCECEDGWFDDGENDCKQCEYPCLTCEFTNSNCLTCIFGLEDRHPAPNCECIDGQFEETDYHCLPCSWKCITCEVQTNNCLSCSDENRTAPLCNCNDGWFGLDPAPLCYQCHQYCKTCEIIPENCLECLDDPNREDAPNCSCIPGYYNDNADNICKKCIYPCLECTDINTCVTCSQIVDPARKDIDLNCKCFAGFYSNQINKCELCPKKCATCHLLNGLVECINENPLLQECEIQCLSCLQSIDNCVNCTPGFKRTLIPPLCGCIEGYYNDIQNTSNNDCIICPSQCGTCAIDISNQVVCLTCQSDQFSLPYCTQQKQSFSLIIDDKVVITECALQCESCDISAENCLKCSSGLNRSQSTPDCFCEQGYYDNQFEQFNCQPCKKECLTCTRYNICTACVEGLNRQLNPQTGMCECMDKYRIANNGDLKCFPCYTYGKNCYIQCPLNTRLNESEGICEDYELQLPSLKIILISIVSMYVLFKIIMCTGIIGKYNLRMQGLRIIEPKIPLDELEQNSKDSESQSKDGQNQISRIQKYFQQGFTQGDPALNISSSSDETKNSDEVIPKIKKSQIQPQEILPAFRGQIPLKYMQDRENDINNNNQNIRQRKHKPKLANLIQGLKSKAKLIEEQKQNLVNEMNFEKNHKKSLNSTQSKFNLDEVKSFSSMQSSHSNKKLIKPTQFQIDDSFKINQVVNIENEEPEQQNQQQKVLNDTFFNVQNQNPVDFQEQKLEDFDPNLNKESKDSTQSKSSENKSNSSEQISNIQEFQIKDQEIIQDIEDNENKETVSQSKSSEEKNNSLEQLSTRQEQNQQIELNN